jgi:hypothetical protein
MSPNPQEAELGALGTQLDAIIQEWRALRARDEWGDGADTRAAWETLHSHLFPLVEAILNRTACGAEGLTIQANAFCIGDEQLFNGEGPDLSAFGAHFVEAVYRFVGAPPLDLGPTPPQLR